MNPDEASAYLQIHKMTLYRLMQKKQVPSFKIGGSWRLKREHLDKWIHNRIEKFAEL